MLDKVQNINFIAEGNKLSVESDQIPEKLGLEITESGRIILMINDSPIFSGTSIEDLAAKIKPVYEAYVQSSSQNGKPINKLKSFFGL